MLNKQNDKIIIFLIFIVFLSILGAGIWGVLKDKEIINLDDIHHCDYQNNYHWCESRKICVNTLFDYCLNTEKANRVYEFMEYLRENMEKQYPNAQYSNIKNELFIWKSQDKELVLEDNVNGISFKIKNVSNDALAFLKEIFKKKKFYIEAYNTVVSDILNKDAFINDDMYCLLESENNIVQENNNNNQLRISIYCSNE